MLAEGRWEEEPNSSFVLTTVVAFLLGCASMWLYLNGGEQILYQESTFGNSKTTTSVKTSQICSAKREVKHMLLPERVRPIDYNLTLKIYLPEHGTKVGVYVSNPNFRTTWDVALFFQRGDGPIQMHRLPKEENLIKFFAFWFPDISGPRFLI